MAESDSTPPFLLLFQQAFPKSSSLLEALQHPLAAKYLSALAPGQSILKFALRSEDPSPLLEAYFGCVGISENALQVITETLCQQLFYPTQAEHRPLWNLFCSLMQKYYGLRVRHLPSLLLAGQSKIYRHAKGENNILFENKLRIGFTVYSKSSFSLFSARYSQVALCLEIQDDNFYLGFRQTRAQKEQRFYVEKVLVGSTNHVSLFYSQSGPFGFSKQVYILEINGVQRQFRGNYPKLDDSLEYLEFGDGMFGQFHSIVLERGNETGRLISSEVQAEEAGLQRFLALLLPSPDCFRSSLADAAGGKPFEMINCRLYLPIKEPLNFDHSVAFLTAGAKMGLQEQVLGQWLGLVRGALESRPDQFMQAVGEGYFLASCSIANQFYTPFTPELREQILGLALQFERVQTFSSQFFSFLCQLERVVGKEYFLLLKDILSACSASIFKLAKAETLVLKLLRRSESEGRQQLTDLLEQMVSLNQQLVPKVISLQQQLPPSSKQLLLDVLAAGLRSSRILLRQAAFDAMFQALEEGGEWSGRMLEIVQLVFKLEQQQQTHRSQVTLIFNRVFISCTRQQLDWGRDSSLAQVYLGLAVSSCRGRLSLRSEESLLLFYEMFQTCSPQLRIQIVDLLAEALPNSKVARPDILAGWLAHRLIDYNECKALPLLAEQYAPDQTVHFLRVIQLQITLLFAKRASYFVTQLMKQLAHLERIGPSQFIRVSECAVFAVNWLCLEGRRVQDQPISVASQPEEESFFLGSLISRLNKRQRYEYSQLFECINSSVVKQFSALLGSTPEEMWLCHKDLNRERNQSATQYLFRPYASGMKILSCRAVSLVVAFIAEVELSVKKGDQLKTKFNRLFCFVILVFAQAAGMRTMGQPVVSHVGTVLQVTLQFISDVFQRVEEARDPVAQFYKSMFSLVSQQFYLTGREPDPGPLLKAFSNFSIASSKFPFAEQINQCVNTGFERLASVIQRVLNIEHKSKQTLSLEIDSFGDQFLKQEQTKSALKAQKQKLRNQIRKKQADYKDHMDKIKAASKESQAVTAQLLKAAERQKRKGKNLWKRIKNRLLRPGGTWKPPSFVYQFDSPFPQSRKLMRERDFPYEWQIKNYVTKSGCRPFIKPVFNTLDEKHWNVLNKEGKIKRRKEVKAEEEPIVKPKKTKVQFISKLVKRLQLGEKKKFESMCQLIKPLHSRVCHVSVTGSQLVLEVVGPAQAQHITISEFVLKDWMRVVREYQLSAVRRVVLQRYIQRHVGAELYFADCRTMLLVFESKSRRKQFVEALSEQVRVEQAGPQKYVSSKKPSRWVERTFSNFQYLMWLNRVTGRSFSNLSQYPIVPWTYIGPDSQRVLQRNMGCNGSVARLAEFRRRYSEKNEFELFSEYHFGTFYSSAAIVCNFLLRLKPFSDGARFIQNGKFDLPDRLFLSFAESWDNATTSTSDVRELTPEFYYLPEMFVNLSNYDLGTTQNGVLVSDVLLPAEARADPYRWVCLQRQHLESEGVSRTLNHWVDLVYGYKMRGELAVESVNIFYPLTYEDSIDLDKVESSTERISFQSQMAHYGQTPAQIIVGSPHPHRQKADDIPFFHRLVVDQQAQLRLLIQGDKAETVRILLTKFVRANKLIQLKASGVFLTTCLQKQTKKDEVLFKFRKDKAQQLQLSKKPSLLLDPAAESPAVYLVEVGWLVLAGYWRGLVQCVSTSSKSNRVQRFGNCVLTKIRQNQAMRLIAMGNRVGEVFLVTYGKDCRLKLKWRRTFGSEISDLRLEQDSRALVVSTSAGKISVLCVEDQELLATLQFSHGVSMVLMTSSPLYSLVFYSKQTEQLCSYGVNGQFLSRCKIEGVVGLEPGRNSQRMDCVVVLKVKGIEVRKTPFLELVRQMQLIKKLQTRFERGALAPDGRVLALSCANGLGVFLVDGLCL